MGSCQWCPYMIMIHMLLQGPSENLVQDSNQNRKANAYRCKTKADLSLRPSTLSSYQQASPLHQHQHQPQLARQIVSAQNK